VRTTPEWEQVLELALIWCVLGFLWSALRKRKPIASFLSMAENFILRYCLGNDDGVSLARTSGPNRIVLCSGRVAHFS
jgi:hypothetical protein